MTREQLDAIRARVEAATPGPWRASRWPSNNPSVMDAWGLSGMVTFADAVFCGHARQDVPDLLAEVERLRDAHAMAVQVSGELCEKCGWAMKFPGEKCRCELLAEVERLTAERAALQVGDTESTTLEANERFAPSENVVVYIEKWCDGSGPCAVELEPHGHWRLSRSVSLASVRKAERDAAFSRGVAAMRVAAALACRPMLRSMLDRGDIAATIRDLPDPEDK